jgi:7,8-dihydro-6-hydroxymethylpterin dimethyltransferase
VGWRQIVEKMHMTATLTKWYEEHGRHEIIAGGKQVNLPSKDHSLVLRAEDVNRERQHDLDVLGIAKTAREEKKRARDLKLQEAENARMMKLYRQHVLNEEPQAELVQLSGIAPAKKEQAADREEVGSFGD